MCHFNRSYVYYPVALTVFSVLGHPNDGLFPKLCYRPRQDSGLRSSPLLFPCPHPWQQPVSLGTSSAWSLPVLTPPRLASFTQGPSTPSPRAAAHHPSSGPSNIPPRGLLASCSAIHCLRTLSCFLGGGARAFKDLLTLRPIYGPAMAPAPPSVRPRRIPAYVPVSVALRSQLRCALLRDAGGAAPRLFQPPLWSVPACPAPHRSRNLLLVKWGYRTGQLHDKMNSLM